MNRPFVRRVLGAFACSLAVWTFVAATIAMVYGTLVAFAGWWDVPALAAAYVVAFGGLMAFLVGAEMLEHPDLRRAGQMRSAVRTRRRAFQAAFARGEGK